MRLGSGGEWGPETEGAELSLLLPLTVTAEASHVNICPRLFSPHSCSKLSVCSPPPVHIRVRVRAETVASLCPSRARQPPVVSSAIPSPTTVEAQSSRLRKPGSSHPHMGRWSSWTQRYINIGCFEAVRLDPSLYPNRFLMSHRQRLFCFHPTTARGEHPHFRSGHASSESLARGHALRARQEGLDLH